MGGLPIENSWQLVEVSAWSLFLRDVGPLPSSAARNVELVCAYFLFNCSRLTRRIHTVF
jgi:hypothetical protein